MAQIWAGIGMVVSPSAMSICCLRQQARCARAPFGTFGTTFPSSFAGGTIKPSQLPCGHPPKDKIGKNFFLHVHIKAVFSIIIVEGNKIIRHF